MTYNHDNTYAWFKERVKKLEDEASYDPANWVMAMEKSQVWGDVIPIGKFFQRTDRPSLEECEPVLDEGGPLAYRDLRVPAETVKEFIAELM